MSTYWDFRKILDVDPKSDKRCVAITSAGTRCKITGYTGREHLIEAGEVLDTMDRTLSLSECRGHLDQLAFHMMCGNPHRKLPGVQQDRVTRWNKTISVYKASHVQSRRKKAQTIAAELGNEETVHITLLMAAERSQPQEKAVEHVTSPVSRTVESGTGTETNDRFINNNEITPKHQPQLEDPIGESSDTNTLHAPSDDTTSEILGSKQPEEPENLIDAYLATQSYGLPSPPDSKLVTHAQKKQDSTHIHSPPETPTKPSASTSNAQLGLPRSKASGASLKPTAEGTKSIVKFGSEERASPLQTFNFNFKPDPIKLTNFATKFGAKENTTQIFKFELPAEAIATTGGLSSSSRLDIQEDPNPNTEPQTTEVVSTLASESSFASKLPRNIALNNTIGEDQLKAVQHSPESLSPLPLSATIDEGPSSPEPIEFLDASKPPSTQNISNQEEPTVLEPSSSAPVDPALSLETLKQKPLPTFETASLSKHQDSLPSSDEARLPVFAFVPNLNSVTAKPRLKASSSGRHKLLPASVDGHSRFEFGSNYQVPPKSFDFDTWSKLSLAARMPPRYSTMWSHFNSEQEKNSEIKDSGEEAEEVKAEVLLRNTEKVEEFKGGSAFKKPAAPSKDDLAMGNDESESVSEPLKTPLKVSVRPFEGHMTPETTPEPSQCERITPVLVGEGATTVSGAPESPETGLNEDYRLLNGAPMAPKAAPEPLRKEDKVAPKAIDESSSKPPITPLKTYDRHAEGLTAPETSPEPSQIPENSIPVMLEEGTSPHESTLKAPVQNKKGENEDNMTLEAASEPSQACETGDQFPIERSITAAKPSSELAMVNEDLVSTIEEGTATPKVTLDLPKPDQDSILIIKGDTASCEAEPGLLKLDQEALNIDEEDDTSPKTQHGRSSPDEKVLPIIEDTTSCQITVEPNDDPLPQRAASFGHALVDPAERRYTTRFSERQQQALPTTPQTLEASRSFGDEDEFSEGIIEPFSTPSPGLRPSKTSQEQLTIPQRSGESSPASGKWRHGLAGEQLNWENDRGIPKKRSRRFKKEVLRHMHQGYITVSEAVRRKSGHASRSRQD